jgi:hypothetical protein
MGLLQRNGYLVSAEIIFYDCHWGYSLLEFADFSGKSLDLF